MSRETPDPRIAQIATSTLIAAWVGILFYALDRTYAAVTSPIYDPLSVVASVRIDYFWRMATGGFLAVSAGFAHYLLLPTASSPTRLSWALKAGPPVVILATVLGVLFP